MLSVSLPIPNKISMKNTIRLCSLFIIYSLVFACITESKAQVNDQLKNKDQKTADTKFNPELAKQLNADPYGMKKYVMAILKAGPNRNQDSAAAAKLQKAHLDNISRLANEGKLILAGPFLDNSEMKGIYIFNVETIEEAKKLTETDPAILAGRLIMELHPWYGSAALQQINSIHETIQKEKF